MTHFWPLWALYSCYLIVSLPVGLWFNMRYYLQDDSYSQLQRQVYAISGAMRAAMNPVITFAFAAVMIMASELLVGYDGQSFQFFLCNSPTLP